jgi:hypothetical protein
LAKVCFLEGTAGGSNGYLGDVITIHPVFFGKVNQTLFFLGLYSIFSSSFSSFFLIALPPIWRSANYPKVEPPPWIVLPLLQSPMDE